MTALLIARGVGLPQRLSRTDLTLGAGQLTCVIGPNGSGKTSLLHALARVGDPTGKVEVEAQDVDAAAPPRRQRLISYLPASRDIAWPITARDLVGLGLAGASNSAISESLKAFDLEQLSARPVDRLSTGERSRVLIARTLVAQPRVLLFDEPAANLDPLWQLLLMQKLRELCRSGGRAALLAMHDLDLAARFADRLLIVQAGQIVADGPPQALLDGPDLRVVFGIERSSEGWRPAKPLPGDRRSSP